MSKKLMTLLAMAAAMPGLGPTGPVPSRTIPEKKHKGNTSKCKTCVHFGKYGFYRCSQPMKMACENYSRHPNKKKK